MLLKKNLQICDQKRYRQIYKGLNFRYTGELMSKETIEWWKGLGEELEVDIETLESN